MAVVETWQGDHERRCDERQAGLGREIRDLKASTQALTRGAWGVMIGLLAWALVQLYGQLQHGGVAQAAPAVAAAAPHP